ncbi:MAG: right-handed parallel beta-helix repeat-containing protein, partial [Xanthomonadales bacterium]|nr:right-handed parallel beta-helix repeat-containing protein [Xanthomonadales bacterium]
DDRSVGPSLTGQNGWTSGATCNASLIDQAVSHTVAHTGTQSLRISNWYTSPCVDSILSPTFAAVGEAGSKTVGNTPAVSNTVPYGFWFRSASTAPDPGMSFTTQFSALASYRLSFLKFEDSTNADTCPTTACLHLKSLGIESSDGTNAGSPIFKAHYSPTLVRGDWYHVVIHATFNDGPLNDVVETKVFDSTGTQVWDDISSSWQFGYYSGLFNGHPNSPRPAQGPFAAEHVTFDISTSTGPGPTAKYAGASPQGTQGIYIDDLSVVPGSGASYATNFDSDRYVAVTGSDNSDCHDPNAPCVTIAYALTQANPYDTIHIGSGTYAVTPNTQLEIGSGQDGVRLIGDTGGSMPIITRQGGSANLPLLFVNGARDVHVANLQFDMDQSFVAEGILAIGFVDGLTIEGNHFVNSQSVSSVSAGFGYRNAISINDTRNSLGLGRTNGSSVSISNNVIDGVTDVANGVFLRAGVNMDAGVGTITGNTITTGTHDIHVRFATTTSQSSQKDILIDGNTLNGRGLEFTAPNATGGQVTISNNTIHAVAGIDGVTSYPADWSLVRLIDNTVGMPTTVADNTFSGYTGAYRGVLIEHYPGITLTGTPFTPAANATTFRSLVLSNKEITSDNPAQAPLAMSLTAMGNTFNGSGIAGGVAVELLDDNDANGTASFGSMLFGGSGTGQANHFDGNLRWYFHLDDVTCDLAGSTTCGLINYPGVGTIPDTQMRPFAGNVSATDNVFDGATPTSMNSAQQSALLARTNDKAANSALGNVDYGLTATQPFAYVDAAFAGASYGDALSFTSAAPACGTTTVYFGVNAFASIPEGVSHVQDGGTVCVAKGTYTNAVTLTHPVQLVGDGNADTDTKLTQGLIVAASGASTSSPLLIANLRVSDTDTNGVGILVKAASHLSFQDLALVGNGSSGINLSRDAQDIAIGNSLIDGSKSGLRTSSSTHVSDVTITDTTFSNNSSVGLILFGGSNGTGSATNWTIDQSNFTGNDTTDTTTFGGGIWLDSFGPSTLVDGFTVTNSTFTDNGSASSTQYKRGGINVFVSSGGTLRNVSICSNTFADNAATPGTQLNGIVVEDGSNNSTYTPIEVCADNQFIGEAHSISGKSQFQETGTQPVVNITGGSIANTEYINGLVIRVRDSAKFATISLAMSDVGTVDGDEIDVPAGIYRENVTVSHNNMTLKGAGTSSIIDGTNLVGSGITLPNGRTGVTVADFTVQNFTSATNGACIFGALSNNNTNVNHVTANNCKGGRGGIMFNGPINTLTIDNNDVSDVDGRGIVVWNGFKQHITITNNHVHDMTSCCGIELQDGTASGVTVTGNTVENVADSGMAFIGLTTGAGPNLIDNNTITNSGRFGMEIKLPNGSGAESGDGSIVISNNHVTRPASALATANARDAAGIAVIRRAYNSSTGETDATTGVVVKNNIVTGWMPATGSPNEGFGIVVEGTNSHVYGNTVSNSDIGIQVQAGNDSYPGDSNQAATNAFFSRGNAPASCVDVGSNNFSANGTDQRSVTMVGANAAIDAANLVGGVHNSSAYYCSIQSAIDAATAGDTITVDGGNYPENVRITKSLILHGPYAGTAGYDVSRNGTGEAVISPATGYAINVIASNVTFAGFTIQNVNKSAIVSGGNYSGATPGPFAQVFISNNRVLDVHNGSGLNTNGPYPAVADWQISGNLFSNIDSNIGSGINYWKANGGSVSDNHVEQIGFGGIQVVGSQGVTVTGNTISTTGHPGINVGGVGGINGDSISITGNTLTDTNTSGNTLEGGLTLSAGVNNVNFACNSVSGSGTNGFSAAANATTATGLTLFDNAFDVGSDISNNASQNLDVGSNWYGGGSGSVAGTNSAGTQLAQALAASPIGNAACGDNTPTSLVAVSGAGQTTAIGAAFAQPLVARVTDALGGAVSGQGVSFSAPTSGPSASLGSASGATNYNGEFSTTASANGTAGGPYNVNASSGSLTAVDFALTNGKGTGTVVWGALAFTYDGTAHALTAHLQQEPSVTCTITPVSSVTDAGTYTV